MPVNRVADMLHVGFVGLTPLTLQLLHEVESKGIVERQGLTLPHEPIPVGHAETVRDIAALHVQHLGGVVSRCRPTPMAQISDR